MSVDYTAYALIGVQVPIERLYREKRLRACLHPLPGEAAYCPTCGKPAYRLEAEPIYDDDHDVLDGLKVVFGTDRKYAIVGLAVCETSRDDKPGFVQLPNDIADMYSVIERILSARDIRGDAPIGLYSVLYCSY